MTKTNKTTIPPKMLAPDMMAKGEFKPEIVDGADPELVRAAQAFAAQYHAVSFELPPHFPTLMRGIVAAFRALSAGPVTKENTGGEVQAKINAVVTEKPARANA